MGDQCWYMYLREGGKPENPEKNPRSKGKNQQQTQPTYDAGSGNRTRDTLVGGEPSHHCATPAPPIADELHVV